MGRLHDRVKALRNFLGFTQEKMAEQLGMTSSGYSKIERAETDIPASRLEAIAQVANISLEILVANGDFKDLIAAEMRNNISPEIGKLWLSKELVKREFELNMSYWTRKIDLLEAEKEILSKEKQLLEIENEKLKEDIIFLKNLLAMQKSMESIA